MKITVELLESNKAYGPQVAIFRKLWPEGAEVTLENCHKAAAAGLDLHWAAENLLPAPARKAWAQSRALARQECEEAAALAWKACLKAMVIVRKEHCKAWPPAWKAYQEDMTPAWEEYEETMALAGKTFSEAIATAFFVCVNRNTEG